MKLTVAGRKVKTKKDDQTKTYIEVTLLMPFADASNGYYAVQKFLPDTPEYRAIVPMRTYEIGFDANGRIESLGVSK